MINIRQMGVFAIKRLSLGLCACILGVGCSLPVLADQPVAGFAGGAGGGVNQIVAGTGVILSPPNGLGTVTISATGSGGGSVTNVSTFATPAWLTSTWTNPTTTPAQTIASATGLTSHQVLGTFTGSTVTLGSLTVSDLPLITAAIGGTGTSSAPTAGQILVGVTGGTYTPYTPTGGTGISFTLGSGTLQVNNTGVTSNVAGSGIGVSGATGAVTITNNGVTSNVAGTGIGVSSATGASTISNTGVTSNVAGTGITVSTATGASTISLTSPVATNIGGTGTTTQPTAGQIEVGTTPGNYVPATLGSGTGISTTAGSGSLTINNTGVTSNVAGTGISVSGATGAVTIGNTGVTSNTGGTGITVTNPTGASTIALTSPVTPALGGTGTTTAPSAVGQIPITTSGNIYTPATLTAGSNITITNASGSVTIAASGGGGAVSSVSNSDGTLTISPITGAVVASLANNCAIPGSPTTTTQTAGDNTTKVATDAFVTTAVSNAIAGVNPAVAVTAATAGSTLPNSPTYSNGASGIGATLTSSTNSVLVVDGVTLTLGQRVLDKDETTAANRGIYTVTQLGVSGVAPWILTRATDYDQPSDINSTGAIPVVSGTVNASTTWVQTSNIVAVGTTSLTFSEFSLNPANLLTTTLNSGQTYYGNASNVATAVTPSGDVTTSNTGVNTLATVNSNVGSFTNASITVNGKGLITSASSGSGGSGGFTPNNKSSSFSAVAQNAYFVSATATCTLPTAVSVGGQEILVYLTGSGTTVTFNTTSSQTISGQASGAIAATAQYNVYRFMSDGSNWYIE